MSKTIADSIYRKTLDGPIQELYEEIALLVGNELADMLLPFPS